MGNNSYHVVTINGTSTPVTSSTVLDGFTITGGDATSATNNNNSGGGLYCFGFLAGGHNCSPTLANLNFKGNYASNDGGAVFDDGQQGGVSSPSFTNVTFSGNSAVNYGGAVFNNGYSGTSSPTFTNVTFSSNSAATYHGGAVFNNGSPGTSSPTFTNVTFSGNNTAQEMAVQSITTARAPKSPAPVSQTSPSTIIPPDTGEGACTTMVPAPAPQPDLHRVTFNGNHANLDGGGAYNSAERAGFIQPHPDQRNLLQ